MRSLLTTALIICTTAAAANDVALPDSVQAVIRGHKLPESSISIVVQEVHHFRGVFEVPGTKIFAVAFAMRFG